MVRTGDGGITRTARAQAATASEPFLPPKPGGTAAADLPFYLPRKRSAIKRRPVPRRASFFFCPLERMARGGKLYAGSGGLATGVHRFVGETAGEFGHVVERGAIAGDPRRR